MYISVTNQIRPNKTVDFWSTKDQTNENFLQYFKKNYFDTGKIKKIDNVISSDELTLTTYIHWNCEEYYVEFNRNEIVISELLNKFNIYAEQSNIVIESVDQKNKMTTKQGPNPYPNLHIPDTWNNVEEFADWWIKSGMPLIIPDSVEVFLSDDATSVALFRKNRFQVELYLIHPNPIVPLHEHPGVEVIKVRLYGKKYPYLSNTLKNGESHGAGIRLDAESKGYPLLAIQHWLDRDPETIAAMWKGDTVGPKQESLIKRFNPNAYIKDGFADITIKN